jgi:glycolate oxidase iron-sulfur subunit
MTISDFDTHHAPDPALVDQCVHCGFCLPVCPTYQLTRKEAESPRGRIYLIKAAQSGEVRLDAGWVQHFDACLGCVACTSACPSGVDYGKLIEATRAQIERRHRRPARDELFRAAVLALFPHPRRLRWVRALLRFYQRSGLRALFERTGLLRRLPRGLRALESLAPELAPRAPAPALTPARGAQRMRVGLVLGCVQREFLPQINAATRRVLAAEGCEVVAPPEQPCCGALLVHAGREDAALAHARALIDCFEREQVDVIVSNAAGCGSNLKQYGYLLRDDPAYAGRAQRFAEKCRDVSELLVELGPRAPRKGLARRVAVHDACHLQHAQRIRAQPRALLASIPGLTLLELPDAAICCGSAGIYNVVQPETAERLAERKAELIVQLAPDVVATGNPGCLLQLSAALKRRGSTIAVVHTVELLDQALE